MPSAQPAFAPQGVAPPPSRWGAALAAVAVGLVVAGASLCLSQLGLLRNTPLDRYLGHPLEWAELFLFGWAVGLLAVKLWSCRAERAACRTEVLPAWDGERVPVEEAVNLRARLGQLPRHLRATYLVRRFAAVLDFLRNRGSANELESQLSTLAERDAAALEQSYSLVRFLTWAVPVIGFLGTVLFSARLIADAGPAAGQAPHAVAGDLVLALDPTVLGLGLALVAMLLGYAVEGAERRVLELVDGCVDRQLNHRFVRVAAEVSEFVKLMQHNTQSMLQATEQLVQRQAEVWARSFKEANRHRARSESRYHEALMTALNTALERMLGTHVEGLTGLRAELGKKAEEQTAQLNGQMGMLSSTVRQTLQGHDTAFKQIAQGFARQAETLADLQNGIIDLGERQDALQQKQHSGLEQIARALAGQVEGLTQVKDTVRELRERHEGLHEKQLAGVAALGKGLAGQAAALNQVREGITALGDKQQLGLAEVSKGLAGQAEMLEGLQTAAAELRELHDALHYKQDANLEQITQGLNDQALKLAEIGEGIAAFTQGGEQEEGGLASLRQAVESQTEALARIQGLAEDLRKRHDTLQQKQHATLEQIVQGLNGQARRLADLGEGINALAQRRDGAERSQGVLHALHEGLSAQAESLSKLQSIAEDLRKRHEALQQKQSTGLSAITQGLASQAEVLTQLQDGINTLGEKQDTLQDKQAAGITALSKGLVGQAEVLSQVHEGVAYLNEKQDLLQEKQETGLAEVGQGMVSLAELMNRLQHSSKELKERHEALHQKQSAGLTAITEGLASQSDALSRLEEGDKQMLELQAGVHENLAQLANAGAVDQTIRNLTAAIRLMTVRPNPVKGAPQLGSAAAEVPEIPEVTIKPPKKKGLGAA